MDLLKVVSQIFRIILFYSFSFFSRFRSTLVIPSKTSTSKAGGFVAEDPQSCDNGPRKSGYTFQFDI